MQNKMGEIKTVLEFLLPIEIKREYKVDSASNLKKKRIPTVSFHKKDMITFKEKGSFVLLDFGKEVCGGIRLIVREVEGMAKFHIRLGESISEAMTELGVKNAGNDHSPRDFIANVPSLSDLTFSQSGYRFAFIELCSEQPVTVQNIIAVNNLPDFGFEAKIETDDEELNKIIQVASYTLKLCCQNGYIYDGIKRDRLVWSGDLHQEILTAFYLFGDNQNIRNSISFVKEDTAAEDWVNWIPSYSAWWVINLCDYCRISGNMDFFEENLFFAQKIFKKINACIDQNGNINITDGYMNFFLDWPTYETSDAVLGTAALFVLAAKFFLQLKENIDAEEIINKLLPTLNKMIPKSKQAVAFKFLACGDKTGVSSFLENDGAHGFSTFMAYYLLKANILSGGESSIELIKEYFGAMISRGATTFWEDFDLDWLENSGKIDEFTNPEQLDIHGDFGKYCYKNFRHSLCHGWASGVVAFIIEYIMGVKIENGKVLSVKPNLHSIKHIKADIPLGNEIIHFDITEDEVKYNNL